jgi:short-subunit dehydrogenase involved in D-alanine esterification of teichoic acids
VAVTAWAANSPRYRTAAAKVLITGRNAEKLEERASELPGSITFVNDVGRSQEREALASHVQSHFAVLNVVINNQCDLGRRFRPLGSH